MKKKKENEGDHHEEEEVRHKGRKSIAAYGHTHCSRIYINRMKGILILSPKVLGVPAKLLGVQSNTLVRVSLFL